MKKLLLALPLVAGASWAGTTYYSGAQTESSYNRLLEQLNRSEIVALESKEYNAGFMNSTAVTEVREKKSNDVIMTLKHQINHSPVSVAPDTARFGAANIVTTLVTDDIENEDFLKFLKTFETGEPFVLTTDVAIDGATDSELVINAVDYRDDDKRIETTGAVANFTTTSAGSFAGNINAESFVASEGDITIAKVLDLSTDFNFKKLDEDANSNMFFNADFESSVAELSFVDDSFDDFVSFKGVRYGFNQDLTADEPVVTFGMGVSSIETAKIPLKSANIESTLTGFSVQSMIDNQDFYKDLHKMENPERHFFSEKGIQILRETFVPDTKLSLVINAESVDGDADADVQLWFAGNGSDDGYTGMVTAGDLAKAFSGKANVKADRSAIEATPAGMMLEEPMAQIYLNITDDSVSLDAELEKLLLQVNGQAIPLELMAGEMLQMPLEFALQMM